ncbi:MAG: TIGR02587 family membrane protein [Cyanobacteria bacterium P01_A01_bin.135]
MGRQQRQRWSAEVEELIRGISGGFLFGVPLIYTMEVWWIGSSVSAPLLLVTLAATAVVVFLVARTEGFRRTQSRDVVDAAIDTVEAIAIGLVSAALMLVLLRRITGDTALAEIVGKTIFESVPFAIGVTLANQFLKDQDDEETEEPEDNFNETLADIGATLIGALIIAFNIAPTAEVPTLAIAVDGPWLLLIVGVSLLLSYTIVFGAQLRNCQKRRRQRGLFQDPLSETVMSYLVSLVAAALMLWFFHQVNFSDPWDLWLRYSLLLGLPAAMGGAAGRLAV